MEETLREIEDRIRRVNQQAQKHQSKQWRRDAQSKAERASELMRLKMDQEAFHMALEAVTIDAGNFEALEIMAWIYLLHDDLEKGLEYIGKCGKLLTLYEYDYRVSYRVRLIVMMMAVTLKEPKFEAGMPLVCESHLNMLYKLVRDPNLLLSGEMASATTLLEQFEMVKNWEVSERQKWHSQMFHDSHYLMRSVVSELEKLKGCHPYPPEAIAGAARFIHAEFKQWAQNKLPAENQEYVTRISRYTLKEAQNWIVPLSFILSAVIVFNFYRPHSFEIRMGIIAVKGLITTGTMSFWFHRSKKQSLNERREREQQEILTHLEQLV
jgi:hypothetical protein